IQRADFLGNGDQDRGDAAGIRLRQFYEKRAAREAAFRRVLVRASASAMRDHIDQPKARKAQQADKYQGNGVYDHAMPILIRVFVCRAVGARRVIWPGITDWSLRPLASVLSTRS